MLVTAAHFIIMVIELSHLGYFCLPLENIGIIIAFILSQNQYFPVCEGLFRKVSP